jgi:ABC-type bacteriocin/lantibiotic exporter with double-glycine peptidase domain
MNDFYSFWKRARLIAPASFLSLVIGCLVFSCAAVQVAPGPGNHMIENVPFYAQERYQCGPASLAGVMNYWDANVSPEEIANVIYSESARGTLDIDMVMYAQKKGLAAQQYSGGLEDLRKNIEAGYPLVVLVDYGFSVYQRDHYMVVTGYNDKGVIVNSGQVRSRFIQMKDFMGPWEKTEFWTLLVKPEGKEEK